MIQKTISAIALTWLLMQSAAAQTEGWKYKANIQPVSISGLYNLAITPAINAHLEANFQDLRIVNESGKWVPHVLRFPNAEIAVDAISWTLPFEARTLPDGNTSFIVNAGTSGIDNLVLQLKNTAAERFAEITGSDDGQSWYSITDSILIQPVQDDAKQGATFKLQFPAVSYKQLRLILHNNGKAPFNITGISCMSAAKGPEIPNRHSRVENPSTRIVQKDSNNTSYIQVVQPAAHSFRHIQLSVTGVHYFNRTMEVYVPSGKVHSIRQPGQLAGTFTLSNNSNLQYTLPSMLKADTFYVVVHNADNLPLTIATVATYTDYAVATVYLEAGKQYSLLLDNPKATTPNYDLVLDTAVNKDAIAAVSIGPIKPVNATVAAAPKSNQWMLWLVIGLAGVALAFFAWKLLQDMNRRTN